VCFTDDATGINAPVRCLPIPPFPNVPEPLNSKPWKKLAIWQKNVGASVGAPDLDGRIAVFLDIDVVITGSLAPLFDGFDDKSFIVWRNPTKPTSGIGNTSIFRLKLGSHPQIYQRFIKAPTTLYTTEFRIEQEYICAHLGDGSVAAKVGRTPAVAADPFYSGLHQQAFFPEGLILSFKQHLLPRWPMRLWQAPSLPKSACVVVFHGKPDPDEAAIGHWPAPWYKRWYKTVRPTPWITQNWH
jgi:hypothetical protein